MKAVWMCQQIVKLAWLEGEVEKLCFFHVLMFLARKERVVVWFQMQNSSPEHTGSENLSSTDVQSEAGLQCSFN